MTSPGVSQAPTIQTYTCPMHPTAFSSVSVIGNALRLRRVPL
jgi:hypothetical protein